MVEDEPLLRMMAIDLVEDSGLIALEAADADQAVAILEAHPEIRIVFTDIDLPGGMDGMKLATCIRDRWPPVAIILTSGHLRPAARDLPARSVFFAKPYPQAQVRRTLLEMAAAA